MKDYPLVSELSKEISVPIYIENDANAFGVGESWLGAGQGIANWLGITLGTGVGGCLVLGGRLWHGDDLGFSGEVGHMVIREDGLPCACGLRGCLEAHASGSALVAGVNSAIAAGTLRKGLLFDAWCAENFTPETVYQCAIQGDPQAMGLFDRMGRALGLAIANLFSALGIRTAIVGGGVSAGWDQFIGPLRESLAKHSCMLAPEEMRIHRGVLGDDAAILGAARLALGQGESFGRP
jgi:glucokinase